MLARTAPCAMRSAAAQRSAMSPCAARPLRRPEATRSTANQDAVKALEAFGAGMHKNLEPADPTTVPVMPLASRSYDGSVSGSIDGGLLELNTDSFWPYLEGVGNTLVVVDFFTDWCGPCKLIYPELVKLSQTREDVRFVKVNCNKTNKELGIQLAIKVAPTFHLYRNSVKVAEMTGAKVDKLVALINEQQAKAAAGN
ncbi:Thioredoxin F, chloroplastic [Tetrabaena socialis]|uniref:Thioredoxin F, chloroplastic n=1 Tax=Tetrabaena socialis TaxID=47790 RepID=A0A2J8A7X9_9CHLO|nr:Thioredoxin F, chloroplastic [Tetrabaena socialis]|eukprot:PNH08590.1 Thioredoxin F, chloroplastic [Tetrabaena socialis]